MAVTISQPLDLELSIHTRQWSSEFARSLTQFHDRVGAALRLLLSWPKRPKMRMGGQAVCLSYIVVAGSTGEANG
ncbi:hypothetical protein AB0K16_08210 [Nonomuraea jabiensis]|uniref:hypothetical protein n=1 Tax=Nonomuraea jabiensis TaxID=882448 RepID=UPI003421ECAF